MGLSLCIRIIYFMLYFQLHADSVWNINLQKKQQTITNIVGKRANGKNDVKKINNKKTYYSDKHTCANSADPDQTAPKGAV